MGAVAGSILRGTTLNYAICIDHYRCQPIQQLIKKYVVYDRPMLGPILLLVQRPPGVYDTNTYRYAAYIIIRNY